VVVASEAHPFATTGGLAEVAGGLPRALTRLGHRVTLIVPHYPRARSRTNGIPPFEAPGETVGLGFGRRQQRVGFHRHELQPGLTAVLVDVPELFDREELYGTADTGDYPDNAYRFAVFSRATLEYLRLRGERPSIIHAHDWQAGLVPAYQKMLFSPDPTIGGVPVVFTIHNLAFQGIHPASVLEDIGLPSEVLHIQGMEFWGQVSYLKAGVNFSERLTTVSPRYAREILSPEYGFGFDGILARRADDLTGILNGIDSERWNPAADPYLPATYSGDDLTGKRAVKRALLADAGIDASDALLARPVIGLVSRLTDQKGLDLFAAAAGELMTLDATWILLGSGERRYEELWTQLGRTHPDRVSSTIGYEERLEHLIEGGADMFLMPSQFEPCGLNQLHSLRYGTLPIVRATGGLDDTVADAAAPGGTGFKFAEYTPAALLAAVRRALAAYQDRAAWGALQRNAMRQDYSWDAAAGEYVKVYRALS